MGPFSTSENGTEIGPIFGYLGFVFSNPADLRGAEICGSFLDPADQVLESVWIPFPVPWGLLFNPPWKYFYGPRGIVFVVRVLGPVAPNFIVPASSFGGKRTARFSGGLQKNRI